MSDQPPREMAEAVRLALEHFPVDVERIEFVLASENTTYRVTSTDAAAYALRVHRPGYHTLAELESENAWTGGLAAAGIATPRPLATRAGAGYATVPYGSDGDVRHVGMIEWLDGTSLEDVLEEGSGDLVAIFGELGALIGRMHAHAERWARPYGFVRHRLDVDGLLGDAPFWGPFWDVPELSPSQRDLVLDMRVQLGAALHAYGTEGDRFGLIHSDLLPPNLLVRADGSVAAIDFDDTAYGWFLYDIAVALFEVSTDPRYDAFRAALVAGYRAERALTDDELARLPIFVLVRCLAEIGWFDSRLEGHLTYHRGGRGVSRESLITPLVRQAFELWDEVRPLLAARETRLDAATGA
jgi:Ser/Thr protein kinase RdoA (MazF antagonist)